MNCILKEIDTSSQKIDINYRLSVTIRDAFEQCIDDAA